VQPPLPYRVRFDLKLGEVREASLVTATVTGDVEGDARLDIGPAGSGCEVRLRSRLAPANGFLKAAAVVAEPVIRLGHNWVLDSGAGQFRDRAL
jgi:hypothetical protein